MDQQSDHDDILRLQERCKFFKNQLDEEKQQSKENYIKATKLTLAKFDHLERKIDKLSEEFKKDIDKLNTSKWKLIIAILLSSGASGSLVKLLM